jgi:hypothetical protein
VLISVNLEFNDDDDDDAACKIEPNIITHYNSEKKTVGSAFIGFCFGSVG